jgi:hypothetical protein
MYAICGRLEFVLLADEIRNVSFGLPHINCCVPLYVLNLDQRKKGKINADWG